MLRIRDVVPKIREAVAIQDTIRALSTGDKELGFDLPIEAIEQ
jgi:hypothetical protein